MGVKSRKNISTVHRKYFQENEKERLGKKIEIMREKLHQTINENESIDEIQKTSQLLDQLIVAYTKIQKK